MKTAVFIDKVGSLELHSSVNRESYKVSYFVKKDNINGEFSDLDFVATEGCLVNPYYALTPEEWAQVFEWNAIYGGE